MIRLYAYVEGQTERGYVETVLRGHLANFGVIVAGAILAAIVRSKCPHFGAWLTRLDRLDEGGA